jgi:hypothetical protein
MNELTIRNIRFRSFGTKNRKFQATWLKDFHWMRYSMSSDSVFCAYWVHVECRIARKLLLSSTWPLKGIYCRPHKSITSIIFSKLYLLSAAIFLWLEDIYSRPIHAKEKSFSSSTITDWKNLLSLAKHHENLSQQRLSNSGRRFHSFEEG